MFRCLELERTQPNEIIVIGAHYDSVPLDGCNAANDNASGVAAVLCLARRFGDIPQERTIRFVSFVNEEPQTIPNAGASDHWFFWQMGYKAVMITDTAPCRYPHYPTPHDDWDQIDYDKTVRVVKGLEYVLQGLAKGD